MATSESSTYFSTFIAFCSEEDGCETMFGEVLRTKNHSDLLLHRITVTLKLKRNYQVSQIKKRRFGEKRREEVSKH